MGALRPFRAIVLPTDPYAGPREIMVDGIDAMQSAIGGYFDCVRARIGDDDVSIYVHDEGLLIGLPANRRACVLAWMGGYGDPSSTLLVGDALVAGGVDAEGNTLDVPDDVRRMIL